VGDYWVDDNILPPMLRMWLGDQGNNPVLAAAVRDLTAMAAGRPVQPTPELLGVLGALNGHDRSFTNAIAAIFAVRCGDGGWPDDPDRYWARIQRSRSAYLIFGPHDGELPAVPGVGRESSCCRRGPLAGADEAGR
jgi:hypothetical protein